MDWNSYKNIYNNFEHSISQSLVITLVLQETMRGWPESLPKQIKTPLTEGLATIRNLFQALFDQKISSEQFHAETDRIFEEWGKDEDRRSLLGTALIMYWSRPDKAKNEVDFTRIIHSQGFIMVFAHLDVFLVDSLRTICTVKPDILKCDKKMDWEEIVSCGTWDRLIENLVEKYAFAFGWQSILQRTEFLERQFGLSLGTAKEDLQHIEDGELIRNVIIHNGGKASQEYLKKSGRTDLTIGQAVPVDLPMLKSTFKSARSLAEAVAKAIGKKFFRLDAPSLV